jgi:hypothetical protein
MIGALRGRSPCRRGQPGPEGPAAGEGVPLPGSSRTIAIRRTGIMRGFSTRVGTSSRPGPGASGAGQMAGHRLNGRAKRIKTVRTDPPRQRRRWPPDISWRPLSLPLRDTASEPDVPGQNPTFVMRPIKGVMTQDRGGCAATDIFSYSSIPAAGAGICRPGSVARRSRPLPDRHHVVVR